MDQELCREPVLTFCQGPRVEVDERADKQKEDEDDLCVVRVAVKVFRMREGVEGDIDRKKDECNGQNPIGHTVATPAGQKHECQENTLGRTEKENRMNEIEGGFHCNFPGFWEAICSPNLIQVRKRNKGP